MARRPRASRHLRLTRRAGAARRDARRGWHHRAVPDPGGHAAGRAGRPGHARPGPDRLRQDARLRAPARGAAGRRLHHGLPPARPGSGADPRAGQPGRGGPGAAGPGAGPAHGTVFGGTAAKTAGRRAARPRSTSSSPARAGWPTSWSRATATWATSRSRWWTRPTTWPTWASCPWSGGSWTRRPPDGQRMLFSATLDNDVDVLVRRFLSDPARHAVDSGRTAGPDRHHVLHRQPRATGWPSHRAGRRPRPDAGLHPDQARRAASSPGSWPRPGSRPPSCTAT